MCCTARRGLGHLHGQGWADGTAMSKARFPGLTIELQAAQALACTGHRTDSVQESQAASPHCRTAAAHQLQRAGNSGGTTPHAST